MNQKDLIAGGAVWLLPLLLFPQLSYLPGWPVTVQSPTGRPIYIADIDDDGQNELFMMAIGNNFQDDMLYAFERNGTIMPGFPISGGAFFSGDPALFDSNDDGRLEMAVAQDGNLYLRDQQGNAIWTIPYTGPIFQSTYYPFHVSVDDLDDDGNKEIIVTCYSGGAVFVFDAQGNVKPGWPVLAPIDSYQNASIGDIDGDGQKEIIVISASIWCLKPDGSFCPGFPIDYPFFSGSKPVLADIDTDGYLEIIFGWLDNYLRILRFDGSMHAGYPIAQRAYGIGFGDVNRDGIYDITIGWNSLYSYDAISATLLPNFPITDASGGFSFSSDSPNICNLSDDAGLEIAAGAACCDFVPDGKLYAYNLSGQILANYPSVLLYQRSLTTGCTVNDVDSNGTTDICCGSENLEFSVPRPSTVYCWDTGYPYNLDNVDWAMDGFDLGHTGRWRRLYHISKAGSQVAVGSCQGQGNPCYLPPDGSLIAVDVTAVREHSGANPAGQDVRYSRTLGCGNYEGPVIDHSDGTYTRMLQAPLADCKTDLHAWINEFKLQDWQQIVFTTGCVAPPPSFSLLSPPNHASNQPLTVTLAWAEAGLPPNPNLAVSYDLYFGPLPNPPLRASGLTATQYTVSGLSINTRYFWKVVAKNACGDTVSVLWSFDTVPCTSAPRPFENLSPSDGAVDQPLDVELVWKASDQAFAYDVYLGACPDLLELAATVSGPQATVHGLSRGTTYYWRVIARNACGEREGEVWSFTTACRHCRPVSPP
jgi:hypothetical protein